MNPKIAACIMAVVRRATCQLSVATRATQPHDRPRAASWQIIYTGQTYLALLGIKPPRRAWTG